MLKICTICRHVKALPEFGPDRTVKSGIKGMCRECHLSKVKAYQEKRKKTRGKVVSGKKCTKCGITKHASMFPVSKIKVDWLDSHCKECKYAQNRERDGRKLNYQKAMHLKREYGLSIDEFTNMSIRQGGTCAICKRAWDKPNVDHCHETGKVRSLLCSRCNLSLGIVENNEFLQSALSYLASHGKNLIHG